MTDFRKEVELLISARLKGKADLTSITKSISDLEDAIKSQADAAKKGIGSIDDLRDSYRKLEDVADQLKAAGGLVSAFQKQEAAIAKSEAKLADYTARLAEVNGKIAEQGKATKTQADQSQRYTKTLEATNVALAGQRSRLAELEGELRSVGVDTASLADGQQRIRDAANETNAALLRNKAAQNTFAADMKEATVAINEKAAAEKRAVADADLFAAAEKRASDAAARRAADNAETLARAAANRNAAGASSSAADRLANEQLAAEKKRAAELAAFRADIEQRSAQSLKDTGLAKAASDAENTARSYTTLARASSDLAPKVLSIRDAVNAILNPAAATRSTLAGVESEINTLGKTIAAIRGPVADYQEQFKELTQATKALSNQAGLVDTFRQQVTALRAARAEFSSARADVAQYAAAVRQGGDAGASFTRALTEAQNRAKSASAALASQVISTRQARAALTDAGISASKLASEEQRLVDASKQAVVATDGLTAAIKKYGVESEATAKRGGFFGNDGGRTTLSLVQRLRGEVLALAASYTGLQGAISLANGAIDSTNARAATKGILGVSLQTTNKDQIDAEYAYVKAQSDRIGLVFQDTAKQYAKFATAAALSGRGRQEIRYIFEAFAEGGRVLNLTTDDLNGVFLALEQIFSKGTLGAEELRQQLGERLPGVFEVAEQALKAQFPDLNKAMKEGKVGAEQLVLVAEAYRKMVAEQLPGATKSMIAEQARLTNAVNEFKLAVADGGFAEGYRKALVEITTFLKSEDGQKFAQGLADKFTLLAKALVILVQNFDTLQAILTVIVGLKAIAIFGELSTSMLLLTKSSATAAVALTGVELAVSRLKLAFNAFAAFFVGWEIGTLAYEKFQWVRGVGALIIGTFDATWKALVAGWDIALASIPALAKNAFAAFVNTITLALRSATGLFATFARAVGATGVADSLDKFVSSITVGFENVGEKSAAVRAQLAKDLAAIRKDVGEQFQTVNASTKPAAAAVEGTPFPGPGNGKPKGPSEGEINKRKTQIEEITKALETLSSKIDKAQTDTLQSQLDVVDTQYAALSRKIAKLGGPEAVAFQRELTTSTNELRLQITKQFNDKLAAEQEAIQNKLEGIEAAGGKKQKNDLDARLQAIATQYADTYRTIAAERAKLEQNGLSTGVADAQKARLDAGITELQNIERKKYATEQLNEREQTLTQTIADRDKLVAAIRAQEEARLFTNGEATQKINDIQAAAAPKIEAAAAAAREWALANQAIFANPEQQELFLANIDAITAKANSATVVYTNLQKTFQDTFSNGASTFIDGLAQSIGGLTARTMTWRQALSNIGSTFLQVTAQILKGIAEQIIKQQVLNAVLAVSKALGWGGAGAAGGISSAGTGTAAIVAHSGAVVGGVSSRSRTVSQAMFAVAPRYHGGGISGMAPDEYPAILQKNEEVLAANSPRNIMNGGGMSGGAEQSNRFVLVDDRSRIEEAMSGAGGEKVTLLHLKKNITTVRAWMKTGKS